MEARDPAQEVTVASASGSYQVVVRAGLMERLPDLLAEQINAARYAFISDRRVRELHGERLAASCGDSDLDVTMHDFEPGEASKTRKTWSILTDELLDARHGRDSCVVAVGGGVTGDLAGFVAATFLRGIPIVQIPTTYLAMIDASVGGKTGVDVRAGKNLVGAFHAPRAVWIDPAVLATLPRSERAQGLVEAFKHGVILDAEYFERLGERVSGLMGAELDYAAEAVLSSVRLKASVVGRDEREAGVRRILNFGHTVGHAVEAASGYARSHGSAVALGMLVEAHVGEAMGVTEGSTFERLLEALIPLEVLQPLVETSDEILEYLPSDKKTVAGRPRFVLLAEIGRAAEGDGWTFEVPEATLLASLDAVRARL